MSNPSHELRVPPRALLRDTAGTGWLAFDRIHEMLRAESLEEVPALLETAEQATRDNYWAVGFLCYEAAAAFDSALVTHRPGDLPLAWFALCEPPQELASDRLPRPAAFSVESLRPTLTAAAHAAGVERIRRWIARGDTYQVNYTHALHGRLDGDAWGLFRALERGQHAPYAAWLDLDSHVICSASPELFFEIDGDRLTSRPMKGTAVRGRTSAEDRLQAAALATSSKDRAENVMIVDMIRNDMGRVAHRGTVRTTSLFDVERYDTVFQLTSTIEARTAASVGSIVAALFPCASITGAPKVRTMELITALEPEPRGLYTGAIGWLAPRRRARFSVAIRTAVVRRKNNALSYGTGGGIVWESEPLAEHLECEDKARILTAPRPEFELLETLLWRPGTGFHLLDRHLDRLLDSAGYFGFETSKETLLGRLFEAAAGWREARRVRMTVDRQGVTQITSEPLASLPRPLRLALATTPVDAADPFLFHKTTHRLVYERARAAHPSADDVLLWNARGELTESTFANLVLEIGGRRFTPPVASGLLAGTERAELLAQGAVQERVLALSDLRACQAVYLVNSVRGLFRAHLEDSGESR